MVIDALYHYERITFHSRNLHILIKSLELHIILTERLFLDNMDVWHFLRKNTRTNHIRRVGTMVKQMRTNVQWSKLQQRLKLTQWYNKWYLWSMKHL